MKDNYQQLRNFIKTEIEEKKLDYNHLQTTRSAILALVRGFNERGWHVEEIIKPESRFKQYSIVSPDGNETLSMLGGKVFRHQKVTETICRRKHLTKRMLDFFQLPTPHGGDFAPNEQDVARAFFELMPKPVVVKATDSGGSKGVTVRVSSMSEFDAAWKYALADGRKTSNVLVEQFVTGVELRAFVIGDNVVSVVARLQPYVVGDGQSTIDGLVYDLHERRKVHYRAMKMPVKMDWDFISKQGFSNYSVPTKGQIVFLNPFNTPTSGGLVLDVSNVVCQEIKDISRKAKDSIPGLEIAGIDLLVNDLHKPDGVSILEVNTAAALELHRYPTHGGDSRLIEQDIVEYFDGHFTRSK